MPVLFVPAQLRDLTGGQTQVQVQGTTVGQAVEELERLYPAIRGRLRQGSSLASGLQVSIGDRISTKGLLAPVGPESEIHFLPAFGGG